MFFSFENVMFFIITSYIGSELKETAMKSLRDSPSQELHCHMLPAYTILSSFCSSASCTMSSYILILLNCSVLCEWCCQECNVPSWLSVYIWPSFVPRHEGGGGERASPSLVPGNEATFDQTITSNISKVSERERNRSPGSKARHTWIQSMLQTIRHS